MPYIDTAHLRETFNYDPLTGQLSLRNACKGRRAGKRVGTISAFGYVQISAVDINGRRTKFYAHRLAWQWVHGAIQDDMDIDHINRDRSDNRLCNLRLATRAQNRANSPSTAKSGFKGVSWSQQYQKWCAYICIGGKTKNLGRFDAPEQAHAAYCSAAKVAFGDFALTSIPLSDNDSMREAV